MSRTELINELTAICIRQAQIIKAQANALDQLCAQVMEDESAAAADQLRELVGEWED